jgi:hypothetical protein
VAGSRSALRTAAFVAGAGCLAGAAVLGTLARAVFDPGAFAERAAASLSDERVAALVADRVTDALVAERPDLTAVRPLVLVTARGLVSSTPFRGVVRAAARRVHEALFSEGSRRVILSIPDAGLLLRGALEHASPELAAKVPERLQAGLADTDRGWVRVLGNLWRVGRRLRFATETLAALGTILLVLGVWLGPDRRRAMVGAGVALLNAGLVAAGVLVLGRVVASGLVGDPLLRGAVAGLWRTYLAGLLDWGLLLGGLGLVLAAGALSLLEEVDPGAVLRAAVRRLATPPAGRAARLAWALAVLAAGGLAVRLPGLVAGTAAVAAGLTLAFLGARELFRLALESLPAEAARAGTRPAFLFRGVVLTLLGLALVAVLLLLRAAAPPLPPSAGICNGAAALCDRGVAEVVFAGTHNSMSNAEIPDWMFPHQQASIPHQLEDGVRALLIDVHYGFAGAARVKTDLSGPRPTTEALEHAVGREGVEAAIRIRDRLVGADEGRRRLYLCHGFCELGASELVPALGDVRAFLVRHPDDVVLMVIEDYVAPEDLAAAFEESGLADLVHRGPTPPWPTLGQLAAARTTLLVFLESGRAGVPWLRPAFTNLQETPYTFHTPDEFSCRPNRGGTAGALFQVNHWVETTPAPRPSNAALVNARELLRSRLERCERERGRRVNVVAVDFYRSGDLLAVVAERNGLPPANETQEPADRGRDQGPD